MKRIFMIWLLAALIVPAYSAIGPAATVSATPVTYWVDGTSGSDTTGSGTQASPYKTIQKAADMTDPGDTVMIKPGTYVESITVHNSGTEAAPIHYVAVERHKVIISGNNQNVSLMYAQGWADDYFDAGPTRYIDVQGIVFQEADREYAVNASKGWTFEDCVFKDGGGVLMRGGDSSLTRTISEDTRRGGLSAAYGHYEFKDIIIRRANQDAYSPGGYEGAAKVLITDGMIVDGLISYDNYGTGWWMDWDSRDYTVKNSTIFGNHAGMAWENGNVLDHYWASAGIWSEGNPGPGLIENNAIFSNVNENIGLLESGTEGPITVQNNILGGSGGGLLFRGIHRDATHYAGEAVITGNQFKTTWSQIYTSIWDNGGSAFETITTNTPSAMGIDIDGNTYDHSAAIAYANDNGYTVPDTIAWRSYDTSAHAARSTVTANTLAQMQSSPLQIEQNGTVGSITLPFPTYDVYSLTDIDDTTDPSKMHQIPSQTAESNDIDSAIEDADAGVGDVVTIPVYGRLRDIEVDGSTYYMDVYDLQARHVRVAMDATTKNALEQAILPYALLTPYNLDIQLTRKDADGYSVEGVIAGSGDTQAPSAPPNVTSPSHTATSVALTWDASTDNVGVTGYDVYKDGVKANGSPVTGTSYTVASLAANTQYAFTVKARDAADNISAASSALNVTTSAALTVVAQVNAGGSATSPFAADSGYAGGTPYGNSNAIDKSGVTDPAPDAVYQSYRYGFDNSFTYTFSSLTPGNDYLIRLHFAEIYNTAANQRLFNVKINGAQVLTNFDIYSEAGGMNKALVKAFTEEADGSGNIEIEFDPISGHDSACVGGIELLADAEETSTFVKGINMSGGAVTIGGNGWTSYSSALSGGLSVSNAQTWSGTYGFSLSPAADSGTQSMLESVLWRENPPNGQGFTLNQTLTNGNYQVYLWTLENYQNNYRDLDVKLEGTTVASGIGDLLLGHWQKYGPYNATVSDGSLTIDILRKTKGDPQIAGLEIYSTD